MPKVQKAQIRYLDIKHHSFCDIFCKICFQIFISVIIMAGSQIKTSCWQRSYLISKGSFQLRFLFKNFKILLFVLLELAINLPQRPTSITSSVKESLPRPAAKDTCAEWTARGHIKRCIINQGLWSSSSLRFDFLKKYFVSIGCVTVYSAPWTNCTRNQISYIMLSIPKVR